MTKTSAPPITEKVWQSQVVGLAKTLGWRVYHPFLSKWSEKGYPDLTCVNTRQQRIVFIELKTEKGKLTPSQEEWIHDLKAAGQEAYMFRPSDWEKVAKILQHKPDADQR
jgi:NADH:ubiquinone oxidoreductase subunit